MFKLRRMKKKKNHPAAKKEAAKLLRIKYHLDAIETFRSEEINILIGKDFSSWLNNERLEALNHYIQYHEAKMRKIESE